MPLDSASSAFPWLTRLEELHHPGQTMGDVLAGHPARVEGAHGELRPRLADRLRGHDPDRLTDLDIAPSGER